MGSTAASITEPTSLTLNPEVVPDPSNSFKDIVTQGKVLPLFYMGNDSLDAFLEVDLPELQRQVKASEGTMPSMKMDFKDYQSPW